MAIGGISARWPGRRANIVPMSSMVTVQPRVSACALNQSRTCASSSVSVSRQMPPFGVAPILAVAIRSSHRRSGSMVRFFIGRSIIEDRYRTSPAGGTAAHFHRKAAHREAFGRQRFEIVQLFDMAVADLASGAMAFPDQSGIAGLGVLLHGVDKGRVPAPAIGAGDAHTTFEQIERRFSAHAATV